MGSPTSDDDQDRGVGGPAGWNRPGPDQGGVRYPGPPSSAPGQGSTNPPTGQDYPPPGQVWGHPGEDAPTTRLPQPGEQQRGQTAEYPRVGGYPPAGPAGPWPPPGPRGAYGYGGPPGGPPSDGGRSNRGLLIALIVGLVILAGIGVALIIAFTRGDGERASADPSAATGAAPPSSPPSEPSPSESTGAAPPSPTDTAGDRTDELLAAVPVDFPDCVRADLAGDGDVAAVDCGASTTQPGPSAASFHLYEDTATLDGVFAEDATGIGPMPEGETCATAQGVTAWDTAEGVRGGEVACTITDEGLLIVWTDHEFAIEGLVIAAGSTQEELAELADWWRTNSDFQR